MRISDWSSDVCSSDLRAAAEMVPVRGVEDIFVGPLRSRQHADDVARHLLGNLVVEAQRRLDAGKRPRLDTFLLTRIAQRVEILAPAGEQLPRLVALGPAVHGSLVGQHLLSVVTIFGSGTHKRQEAE